MKSFAELLWMKGEKKANDRAHKIFIILIESKCIHFFSQVLLLLNFKVESLNPFRVINLNKIFDSMFAVDFVSYQFTFYSMIIHILSKLKSGKKLNSREIIIYEYFKKRLCRVIICLSQNNNY